MITFPRFAVVVGFIGWACLRSCGAERAIHHVFESTAGASLSLTTYRGSITVDVSDAPEVRVDVEVDAPGTDEKEAERRLDTVDVTFSQKALSLRVVGRRKKPSSIRFDWGQDDRIDLAYHVTVPRHTALVLETSDGSMTVGDGVGSVDAKARVGTLYFKHIDGSVRAETQSGDLIVSRCTGTLALKTLIGTIRVGSAGGRATLKTSSGGIEIQEAKAGVEALAEAGDVAVGFPAGMSAGSTVHADGGSVSARIDPAAHCTVTARSTWGHVSSALPLVITGGASGGGHLSGTLNGGGPVVDLIASGGHVKLQPGSLGPAL